MWDEMEARNVPMITVDSDDVHRRVLQDPDCCHQGSVRYLLNAVNPNRKNSLQVNSQFLPKFPVRQLAAH
jgi:hypothetical protein